MNYMQHKVSTHQNELNDTDLRPPLVMSFRKHWISRFSVTAYTYILKYNKECRIKTQEELSQKTYKGEKIAFLNENKQVFNKTAFKKSTSHRMLKNTHTH